MSIIKKTNKKKILILGNGFISHCLINHFNIKKNTQLFCLHKSKNITFKKFKNVKYINLSNQKKIKAIKKINIFINTLGNIDHNSFNTTSEIEMFKQHFHIPMHILNLIEKNKKMLFIQIGSIDEINQIKKNNFYTTPYALYKNYFSNYLLTLVYNNIINSKIIYVNSVFGIYQKIDRFIPSVIQNFIRNKRFNPNFPQLKRNFIASNDFASSVEKIINKPNNFKNKIIIKSKYDYKISDIVKYIYSEKKNDTYIKKYKSKNNFEQTIDILIVDENSSFESNLLKTMDFYKNA